MSDSMREPAEQPALASGELSADFIHAATLGSVEGTLDRLKVATHNERGEKLAPNGRIIALHKQLRDAEWQLAEAKEHIANLEAGHWQLAANGKEFDAYLKSECELWEADATVEATDENPRLRWASRIALKQIEHKDKLAALATQLATLRDKARAILRWCDQSDGTPDGQVIHECERLATEMLAAAATDAKNPLEALLAFKVYVHQRFDEAGIPADDPENEHSKQGCRVGARFDMLLARLASSHF